MMNNWIRTGLISIILLNISCSGEVGEGRLSYEQKEFREKVCHQDDCALVILSYPYFKDDSQAASVLNEYIEQQLSMMISKEENSDVISLSASVTGFLGAYLSFVESENMSQSWELEIVAELTFQNSKMLSIVFDAYSNTGGAHPNTFRQYINFDKGSFKLIKNHELVLEEQGLLDLAEEKFREFHDVAHGTELKDDGRFFLQNEIGFFLPLAMGFEQEEFVLYYNPYEIGPYVMGATLLRFSKNEVKGIIINKAFD
ncbi:DUF3298 and DUF4163 domain-containing protein [Indibacter alkaliphilus]|nr:DUF3298 and DUF4163 domain-containing protein [Indibacter alkaliphilus]